MEVPWVTFWIRDGYFLRGHWLSQLLIVMLLFWFACIYGCCVAARRCCRKRWHASRTVVTFQTETEITSLRMYWRWGGVGVCEVVGYSAWEWRELNLLESVPIVLLDKKAFKNHGAQGNKNSLIQSWKKICPLVGQVIISRYERFDPIP